MTGHSDEPRPREAPYELPTIRPFDVPGNVSQPDMRYK
jgi:hypothetical protein